MDMLGEEYLTHPSISQVLDQFVNTDPVIGERLVFSHELLRSNGLLVAEIHSGRKYSGELINFETAGFR